MQPELLLFDIGNTSIKIGLAHERQVVTSYTLRTDAGQTADDLGLKLTTLLGHAGVTPQSLRACVASSVVPGFDPLLREALTRYVDCPLYRVGADVAVPLENRYERPPILWPRRSGGWRLAGWAPRSRGRRRSICAGRMRRRRPIRRR